VGGGFWQCKLRYKTQKELLEVAREYHRRKLPVSVMVIDFHHWAKMGDWTFDPECWPDPKAMVEELKSHGHEVHGVGLADGRLVVCELRP
jgi:alpha-D-xyloside xylohydrolase